MRLALLLAGLAAVSVGIAQGLAPRPPQAGQSTAASVNSAPHITLPFTTSWLNPLPQGMDIRAVDFVDDQTGCAVGDSGTILWSTDGGVSWAQQHSGASGEILSVDLIDARSAWASVDGSLDIGTGSTDGSYLLHTTDAGQSWQRVEVAAGLYGSIFQLEFTDAQHGLALCQLRSTSLPLGGQPVADLLRTQDGGATWTRELVDAGSGIGLSSMAFASPSRGWAVGTDYSPAAQPGKALIYRTDDGGATWTKLAAPPMLFGADTVTADSGQDVWLLGNGGSSVETSGQQLYHSSDGGNSWQLVSMPRSVWTSAISFSSPSQGWIAGSIRQDRWTSQVEVLHTADGGKTWSASTLPNAAPAGIIWGLKLANADASHAWCVGPGGFMARSADGLSWQRMGLPAGSQPLPPRGLSAVAFTDATHGWVAGEHGTIWQTHDGQSWQALSAPVLNYSQLNVATPDGRIVYALGFDGKIQRYELLRTIDAGASWRRVRTNLHRQVADRVFFLDARYGWICGGQRSTPYLLSTRDGGAHWRLTHPSVHAVPLADLLAVWFVDRTHGWAAADKYIRSHGGRTLVDTLLKTSDGGRTWQEVRGPKGGRISATSVQFQDRRTGWAISAGGIWRTIDGGSRWRLSRLGTGWQVEAADFVGQKGWALAHAYDTSGPALGTYQGLFVTSDGGLTWQGATLPGNQWAALAAPGPDVAYLVSGAGGILKIGSAATSP